MTARLPRKSSLLQRYRRNGIRQTKSLLSSTADVVSVSAEKYAL